MPGDESTFDVFRIQDPDSNSKKDTPHLNPKTLGRDKEVEQINATDLNVTGTIDGLAPDDAEYVVTSTDTDLSNEKLHSGLSGSDLHSPKQHNSTHAAGGSDEFLHASQHENGGADEINVSSLSGDLADRQDPKNHSSRHSADAADEVNVTALGEGTLTTDDFLKFDGSNLVGDPGAANVPDWVEDGNSTQPITSGTSETYTMSTNSDVVEVFLIATADTGSNVVLDLQVNEGTGTFYDFTKFDGTTTTGATSFEQILSPSGNNTLRGRFELLAGSTSIGLRNHPGPRGTSSATVDVGGNAAISGPVTNFTLSASNDFSGTIEVFRRTIG